ncbi:hypothetical protein GQ55_5G123800 [Panicum hallii var. hallii]|uniref:Uncharacterized protein n=1 Tax=Panicum hallii var. hallii TaxID=1504633 RepID=A0A2T7DFI3_9POAL|nr:hypothetical protein GQ55_5G123800 [Panicum hallii var. hallii]
MLLHLQQAAASPNAMTGLMPDIAGKRSSAIERKLKRQCPLDAGLSAEAWGPGADPFFFFEKSCVSEMRDQGGVLGRIRG